MVDAENSRNNHVTKFLSRMSKTNVPPMDQGNACLHACEDSMHTTLRIMMHTNKSYQG